MGSTFVHKLILTVFAGFTAACLLWFFRHVVQSAIHETGSGWSEKYGTGNQPRRQR